MSFKHNVADVAPRIANAIYDDLFHDDIIKVGRWFLKIYEDNEMRLPLATRTRVDALYYAGDVYYGNVDNDPPVGVGDRYTEIPKLDREFRKEFRKNI